MGTIHYQAEATHFAANRDHLDLVRPFLSCFDVTHGRWRTRGNEKLAYFYLKAEPFIAELIGLEREMLLAYAPFPSLQARTIKLLDEVFDADRTRLDPVGSILVTDDPETRKKVREYMVTDPERPPIVSLSRDELRELNDANAVRGLFVEQLFRRDLFGLESPLRTETTFFGRTEIVTELFDRYRSGQNSGLFGLRRIGKTSVLYALSRRAEAMNVAGAAFLDVSSPALYGSRWWELLQRIIQTFAAPLNLQRGDRSRIRGLTIAYQEKDAAGHFKADVLRLADHLPGHRLLLLLDEIEYITFDISPANHWITDFLPFWQTLRSVHQETQAQFGFVVVGVNPHILEADRVGQFDNPLFSTTHPFYLGPFDPTTVRDMVRKIARYMGLRCQEGLFQRLFEEYGGHPYLVRQACSQLAKKVPDRPGELTASIFERERRSISLSLERNIRQILNVLAIWYPDEYEMIRILAQGDKATFVEFAEHSAAFTQHVEGYGLVRDARGDPKLLVGLVREHLSRVAKSPAKQEADLTDLDAVLAEISRRRNAIETRLRRVLRDGLKFSVGRRAADQVLEATPSERRTILAQYSYGQVWEELYFSELAGILARHWDAFARFFPVEKGQIVQWLEHINRCRGDAHARPPSADDLAFLRVCFRRLEELLESA